MTGEPTEEAQAARIFVNQGVDIRLELAKMDGVEGAWEEQHRIRVLTTDGKDWVGEQLRKWKASSLKDYRRILRTVERVARYDRVREEKFVRRDAKKTGIYEMKCAGLPRILFFYDTDEEETVICVHTHQKGRGNQGNAFENAAWLRDVWINARRIPGGKK